MRKEEWGWTAVGSLLLSLVFPPYFVAFLAICSLGGLGYLLRSLTPQERELLVEFEKEFRKGYKLELAGKPDEAVAHYRSLSERYPRFIEILTKRIDWVREHPEDAADHPPYGGKTPPRITGKA